MSRELPSGKWQWYFADHAFLPKDHAKFRQDITRWLLARQGKPEIGADGQPTELTEVQQRLIRDALTRRHRFLWVQAKSARIYTDEEKAEALATGAPLRAPPQANAVLEAALQPPGEKILDPLTGKFECPCCFRTLPPRYREPEAWWKHVESDVGSGTCLLDHCLMKPRPFAMDQFYKHVRVYHDPEKSYTLRDIDSPRRFPLDPFPDHCPICNYADEDRERVVSHICKELRFFALMALPWATERMLIVEHEWQKEVDRLWPPHCNVLPCGVWSNDKAWAKRAAKKQTHQDIHDLSLEDP
ncbi:uncharacterized protein BO72DRAFT_444151 [Aspergillus fijiensis CBS 313.89]|uniref:Uncharacterized protein n=1 Tax=Aspergillus fijiensis CBS 313.89 TaxID=1448319 RepID=A0A8G1S0N6_9EURO|nr:uncharacterized protein BO72DRAFT_444151 [Aspergillus fijiensis CBS 313.89]RAK82227.1 hypothetical protein BO72DRAFT_444151 [Aspergillus fijiensis CBS 313.89]